GQRAGSAARPLPRAVREPAHGAAAGFGRDRGGDPGAVDVDPAGGVARGRGCAGGRGLMAVNKLQDARDDGIAIQPMRVADLDAVIEIERAAFPTASTAQVLLEEMARDWAFVDVVRDVTRR